MAPYYEAGPVVSRLAFGAQPYNHPGACICEARVMLITINYRIAPPRSRQVPTKHNRGAGVLQDPVQLVVIVFRSAKR